MLLMLQAVGLIIFGCYLVKAGFSRGMRQARLDPEDSRPIVRSDGADRVVRTFCFVLGAVFLVAGLFLLLVVILG